jgi:hypothetical protein
MSEKVMGLPFQLGLNHPTSSHFTPFWNGKSQDKKTPCSFGWGTCRKIVEYYLAMSGMTGETRTASVPHPARL